MNITMKRNACLLQFRARCLLYCVARIASFHRWHRPIARHVLVGSLWFQARVWDARCLVDSLVLIAREPRLVADVEVRAVH